MPYFSTQIYDGFSCCFRNWRSTSVCHYLHGSSLSFKITFGCEYLDDWNYVQNVENIDEIKDSLKQRFDHKTAVAMDDPLLETFMELERKGLMQLTILPNVGCEAFALTSWSLADKVISRDQPDGRVWVESCEVLENSNSAIYVRDKS